MGDSVRLALDPARANDGYVRASVAVAVNVNVNVNVNDNDNDNVNDGFRHETPKNVIARARPPHPLTSSTADQKTF
jgi:hypothetical protein